MLTQPPFDHASGDETRPETLSVDISCPGDEIVVVTPAGEADLFTVPRLRQALRAAIDSGCHVVVVDLDQLTFLDASTLGVLVEARRALVEAGRTLQVQSGTRRSRRLLTLTGLDNVLEA